ncbi:delta(3,5)-Delta(2,4)-dienoyl-CoA isomerase, mitochondrial [Glossina fuscipes]|uniref:Delta(3,5)-Delta(2,4)-dienoyl-CoA isomerase, mitochondrial n=1 Tax=Glossina fuscipes TaxID=7396 RepID=A0A8U0WHM4_9MUSC|nr:delta(3,5)-Delta(2,4)-dienoyl-CoA isomerase, mitochondrial [Glossina fuscipes]KAI9590533.1 hypothetical protein GQX74_008700 [Glossina fuscipes]
MFMNRFARTSNLVTRHLLTMPNSRLMSSKMLIEHNDPCTNYETLAVSSPKPFVFQVELNRPQRYNAINKQMWMEIKSCFESLSTNSDCRVIILKAAGKHFTAGIDLTDMMQLGQELSEIDDVARKGIYLDRLIKLYQDSLSSLENCTKPVISAVHSACVGAGIDMITASDIRYCSEDAFFSVKEVDVGMAADVGTLQRLPKAIGSQSLVRELCYTGRNFSSSEAYNCGLISKVFPNRNDLLIGALELADSIAQKSPVAVQATKQNLVYSLSRTNQEGLDHIREMNKLYLQSEDLAIGAAAQLTKGEMPAFSKL